MPTRLIAASLLLALTAVSAPAQDLSALAELEDVLDASVHYWRFTMGDEALHAEGADYADDDWVVVDLGHRWWPNGSTCWFRKRITIPSSLHGVDVTGSQVRLKLGVDNAAKAYVNGVFQQRFSWAEGDIVLTEKAQPGETVVVALFGMNGPRLRRAKDDVLILAPGPINRGLEITPEVADGGHSVILDQVTNGLMIRMACLYLLNQQNK